MIPLRATYRLQLNRDFPFARALDLVPYLDDLGVSHAYLSPVLMAQPGSAHGYDTVDHTRINPELGTLEELAALSDALHARGMGIILDFVPNHMGVGGASNTLWLDVLKHGPDSRFSDWFDIDWQGGRRGAEGKLLVPFLGETLDAAIANGAINLKWTDSAFDVWAYDTHRLPIRAEDEAALLAEYVAPEAAIAACTDPDVLRSLLARQHWRLAHFSTAADEINYRRFFVNSELAGIKIDREDVFDHAHGLMFSLIERGLVDGLRIDHVDGLRDPTGYLRTLREKTPLPIHLFVEKILAPHEYLRADWPVDGTTGYEAGAQLTRLLTPDSGEAALTALYDDVVGPHLPAQEEAYRCKLRVMDSELSAELVRLARDTGRIAWSVPATADLTEAGLRQAWREIIAQLDVYRTYATADGVAPRDQRELSVAIAKARRARPQLQPTLYDFVTALLDGTLGGTYDQVQVADVTARFQQLTGPVMAKGLEDTALYRFNRLLSLNDVGAHPDRFSFGIAAFHDSNRRRQHQHPRMLLATSTHDTKRGEDARLLIASIADSPSQWQDLVAHALQCGLGAALDRNDFYMLLQMMLGGWSLRGDNSDFADRLKAALVKSLREGRVRSDWGVPDQQYEETAQGVVDQLLNDASFMQKFSATWSDYSVIAQRKALIQTTLKLTMPGVPDIYRGAEDWEQSFVDPDNRRPVDFPALARRLAAPKGPLDAKLALTQTLLRLRRNYPALFAEGDYIPMDGGDATLIYARRLGEVELTAAVDLSPGHSGGFSTKGDGDTIAGSADGPFWVTLQRA